MNYISLKNIICAPILLAIALFTGEIIGQHGAQLEIWGGLFLLGCIVLFGGIVAAWRLAHNGYNVTAVVVSGICAVILTGGALLFAPEIGWEKSLVLMALVIGWIVGSLILAFRKAPSNTPTATGI